MSTLMLHGTITTGTDVPDRLVGETALVQPGGPRYYLVQVDRFNHPDSHRWVRVPRSAVTLDERAAP